MSTLCQPWEKGEKGLRAPEHHSGLLGCRLVGVEMVNTLKVIGPGTGAMSSEGFSDQLSATYHALKRCQEGDST